VRHVVDQLDQHHVFEHVGVVASVESVSITEHVPRVAGFATQPCRSDTFFTGPGLTKEMT